MKVLKIVIISLVSLISAVTAMFFLIGYFREKPGGVFIDASPVSNVFINGNLVGRTPYTSSLKVGEITLKLVPKSSDKNLIVYETKIQLIAGIQTVIRREFGDTEDSSSGDVISFDKLSGRSVGLVVTSIPLNAQVSVDGLAQGFAPYETSAITPAEHQITVGAPGYTDRIMTVKTQTGYRLSLFAKLAKVVEQTPTSTPVPEVKTYVQILSTPTGFLRMRTEPGSRGEEIAELKVGSKYLYLDTDVATGWYEIQYQTSVSGLPNGITGWVSNQYSLISTESGALK